ncbi:MAG: hypothetical protein ACREC6_15355, partial [Hyphomicrobiaceae bacterium]
MMLVLSRAAVIPALAQGCFTPMTSCIYTFSAMKHLIKLSREIYNYLLLISITSLWGASGAGQPLR